MPEDNKKESELKAKVVEKIIDQAILEMRESLSNKTAKLEELYIETKDLVDMTLLTDSVVIGSIAAVRAYDISTVSEDIAREWLKDFHNRIFRAIKEHMPNTEMKFICREKKQWEK